MMQLTGLNFKNIQQLIQLDNNNIKKQPNQKMGRRPKQILLQRRHTDGQEAHKKILTSLITAAAAAAAAAAKSLQSCPTLNANQNYSEGPLHTRQNGHHQIINAGQGVEKREPSGTVGEN